tara:strand:+ start:1149 stop:1796 length:648 start_codon:yes stop_codon:yes gene_type:complete
MYKKKSFFITFEGIEGSGKSYQSHKLYKNLIKNKIPTVLTREPGGTRSAEKIRKLILEDYFHRGTKDKFDKHTDTLLYLAARNEHIINKIKKEILKKKVIICDRFIDSTSAYQVFGKGVDKKLVDAVHHHILRDVKPDLTFVLKVNINVAMQRLKKRKNKNRYDKFSKDFYNKVQKAFFTIANKNKKRCILIDNSVNSNTTEKLILKTFIKKFKK